MLASNTTNTGLQQITTAPATAILVSAEQAAEFEGIQALLAQLQSIVTTKGKNLSSSDIQPLFSQLTPPYLRGGEDLAVDTADQVTALRGIKMSNVTSTQLNSVQQDPVDSSKNDLNVVYQYNVKQHLTAPGVTEVFQCSNPFASGGSCYFVGDQQIAQTTDAVTEITSTTSDSRSPRVPNGAFSFANRRSGQLEPVALRLGRYHKSYFKEAGADYVQAVMSKAIRSRSRLALPVWSCAPAAPRLTWTKILRRRPVWSRNLN